MSRSEVVPHLFVGSKPAPGRHDVDTIILAAIEYQPHADCFQGSEVIHAPLEDAPTRSMHEQEILIAVNTAARVARRLRAGHRVLVTCALGLNRSALIAAIAMNDVYGMSADEVITRLHRARGPWALSNPNFERLLRLVSEPRTASISGAGPTVSISTPRGEATVAVEIVSTPHAIHRGLMFRDHLPRDAGMLFVMGADDEWAFYMLNTRIPLDMIFITRDLIVAGVISNAEPCTETLRNVGKVSRYVLEVNGGWAAAHQVTEGAKVRFEGVALSIHHGHHGAHAP